MSASQAEHGGSIPLTCSTLPDAMRSGVLLYFDKKTRPDNRTDPFFDFFVLLHEKHTVVIELFARVLLELVEQILNGEL